MVQIQFRNLVLKIDFLAIEKNRSSSKENENLLYASQIGKVQSFGRNGGTRTKKSRD